MVIPLPCNLVHRALHSSHPSRFQRCAMLITKVNLSYQRAALPYDIEDLKIWLSFAFLSLMLLQPTTLFLIGVLQSVHRDLPSSMLTLTCITTAVVPNCCFDLFKILLWFLIHCRQSKLMARCLNLCLPISHCYPIRSWFASFPTLVHHHCHGHHLVNFNSTTTPFILWQVFSCDGYGIGVAFIFVHSCDEFSIVESIALILHLLVYILVTSFFPC